MSSRLKPHHIVRIIGVGVALFTFGSYLAPFVFEFDEASDVTRKVFGNVPAGVKLAFYTTIPMLIVYGGWVASYRVKNWERGRPDNRRTTLKNAKRRVGDFRAGVYMQTLLREPGAGVMHAMIYFGFLILLGVTTVLEVNHQLPTDLKFLHGNVYRAYAFIGDSAGLIFTIGIVWAIIRRYGPFNWRPYRIRIKSKPEHAVILGTFLAISITGYGAEMFRIALEGMPEYERWSFIGYPLATLVENNASLAGWHQFWWIAHVISFIAFLVILPTTMLRHMFTSPLNMYLKDRDRPKGAMKPMPNLVEGDTELETFGASVIEDFTWKQLLDTDACTMCGRCTSVCPAHATGKPDWAARAAFLTPITKAFGTDTGIAVSDLGIQVHGGMGYIEETGAAQYARDVRVTAIYEGTNGIQSMDLAGRKLMDGGEAAYALLDEIERHAESARSTLPELAEPVWNATESLREATEWMVSQKNMTDRFAGSVPFLRAWARVLGGHFHLCAAQAEGGEGKRTRLARFYIKRLLPEHAGHIAHATAGADDLYALTPDDLVA